MRRIRDFFRKTTPALGVLLILSACLKTDPTPDVQQLAQDNETQIKDYAARQNLAVQRTTSGLYYAITSKSGNTRNAQVGEQVTYHYVIARLSDGVKIDSSSRLKNVPSEFPIGAGLRVPGLEEGLTLMSEGDKAVLLVPFYLAYGSASYDLLPPYSAIRYDVELLKIRNEAEQIDEYIAAKKLGSAEITPSGLRFIRTQTSTGATPTAGQTALVAYTGKLLNESQFDIGTLTFMLGQGRVAKGFEEGIAKMKVGEKALLIFPSALGYGKDGVYSQQRNLYIIPPYAPLYFEVELKDAR
jgi:FKBP-type peptidyl-prolyl cis-trans isomerase